MRTEAMEIDVTVPDGDGVDDESDDVRPDVEVLIGGDGQTASSAVRRPTPSTALGRSMRCMAAAAPTRFTAATATTLWTAKKAATRCTARAVTTRCPAPMGRPTSWCVAQMAERHRSTKAPWTLEQLRRPSVSCSPLRHSEWRNA